MTVSDYTRQRLSVALTSPSAADELTDLMDATSLLSATEAGYLDGVTAGTSLASKAVVLNSSRAVAGAAASGHGMAFAGGTGTASGAGGAISVTGGAGGATSGTGGAASLTAGAGTNGDSAGGVAAIAGGAGQGTGAGGATTVKGGASGAGATGNGGAASVTGGAALSTNGTGGAASVIGGVATGTGTGGGISITGGASAGAGGTGGTVTISSGAATGGTEGSVQVQGVATGKLGFYSVTPVVRAAALTQTYATAERTHANLTSAALTDNTTGSATTTLEALPDPTDTPATADALRDDLVAVHWPAIRNNFADLAASNNAIIVDLTDLKQFVNSIVDDLQAYGILQ